MATGTHANTEATSAGIENTHRVRQTHMHMQNGKLGPKVTSSPPYANRQEQQSYPAP